MTSVPSGWPWSVLDLPPGADRTAIRRAYAARLKVTNPEDDPEGFQRLRAAYDEALAWRGGAPAPSLVTIIKTPGTRDDGGDDLWGVRPADPGPTPEFRPVMDGVHQILPAPDVQDEPPPVFHGPWTRVTDLGDAPRREPGDDLQDPLQQEGEAFDQLLRQLHLLVFATPLDQEAVTRTLTAILASPALHAIERHERADRWFADLLRRRGAGIDLLIEPVATYFGWSDRRIGSYGMPPELAARRRRLATLRAMAKPGHRYHKAWRALTRPPVGWQLLRNRLAAVFGSDVRAFLKSAHENDLMDHLDPDAVAWWRRRLDTRETWLGGLFLFGAMSLYIWVAPRTADLRPTLILQAVLAAIFVIVFCLLSWKKKRDAQRRRKRAHAWE